MKRNILFSLFFFIIIISCKDKIKKERNLFSLQYNNGYKFVRLSVFNDKDTIFLCRFENSKWQYQKIKASDRTIEKIRQTIINHLKPNALVKKKNDPNNKGILSLELNSKFKKFKIRFSDVNNDLGISEEFSEMISDLRKSNSTIDSVFKFKE